MNAPAPDHEEVRISLERLRALLESLVVTGVRACGEQQRVQLKGFAEELEQSGAAHRIYERLGFERRPELDWTPVPGVDLRGYALRLSG